ncbi:hypothetical protein D3C71_1419330 [compost metagenome]
MHRRRRRRQAGAQEDVGHLFPDGAARGAQDPVQVGQPVPFQAGAAQPRGQAAAGDQARLLVIQHFEIDVAQVHRRRRPTHHDVQRVVAQLAQQGRPLALVDGGGDAAALRQGAADGRRQHLARHEGDDPDVQVGGMAGRDGLHFLHQVAQVMDQPPGPGQHHGAQRGGRHAPDRTVKERHVEHAFQFGQGVRHGRLAGGHVFRHPGQRPVLLDLQQQHQVTHLQAGGQFPDNGIRVKGRHRQSISKR